MASTYSSNFKLEKMATGANANTWGTNTNNNLDVLDAFGAGYLSKSVAGSANITLSTANADPAAEASNRVIELTGALTGDIVVFIPAVESNYTFFNNTTGSQTLTIAATGHTANGVAITQGAKTSVYCDGASNYNVEISSTTDLGSQTGTLPAVSGANLTNLNASNLGSGTVPDARFPATLPTASGANLTTLNASELDSGTVPDARFPATLPQVSGANLTDLNASNVASGTVASDRLPTVPTTKGGTGLTSIGSASQVLKVNSGGTALEFGDAGGGGGTNTFYFTSPGTYTPNSAMKSVRVEVIGGGGQGGYRADPDRSASGGQGGAGGYSSETLQSSTVTGPVSITAGSGTNSFGSFLSASGGSQGGIGSVSPGADGSGGSGSGGQINITGGTGSSVGRGWGEGSNGYGAGGDGVDGASYNPGRNGIVVVEEYI